MPELPLTPAEVNDAVRAVWVSIRVVLLGSLAQFSDKDRLVEAVRNYDFPADAGSFDHDYATFEFKGQLYCFMIEPDKSLPQSIEDGRVITIGLCEKQEI